MKTIGLLGGMSWESTLNYYRAINQCVRNTLGGFHSAKIVLYSVDFAPIEKLQRAGDWDGTAKILSDAARRIEHAGADCLLLCTNTMHKVAPQIEQSIQIPLLHIADATADALVRDGVKKVGLLGTAFTMEQEFYKQRLTSKYGLEVITPDKKDRQIVNNTIFHELVLGNTLPESKIEYMRIIKRLTRQGAEAVILGCTEIGILISQADTEVRLYDTAALHAEKAVSYATSDMVEESETDLEYG